MVNEQLLATYSLLSYIKENLRGEENESMVSIFKPLVKEGLNRVLRNHNGDAVMGQDFTEIRNAIIQEFELDIPVVILQKILPIINNECGESFIINSDHSFIIKSECAYELVAELQSRKNGIVALKNNYKHFCKYHGVEYNFDELVTFIQDQKNRIFEKKASDIDNQGYHVSKYVYDKIKVRDKYFDTICDIYLGGIISSYLNFQINERIVDTELLIDTNFYISLINLNTQEAYDTCTQLFELTRAMGYRFSILETTIEQIRILISSRADKFNQEDLYSRMDVADVLFACERNGFTKDDLLAFKDNLKEDLRVKGISTIYNQSIRTLVEKAEHSEDLKRLTQLRNNRESALNDILAQEYVDYKRKGKAISEFNDVNCWFLTNSYTLNKRDLNQRVWERRSITASDLLVLLWFANPSLSFGRNKKMLAITSLSANVIKYRSERYPKYQTILTLQEKISRLQTRGNITQKSIANLCIRMSEGCVDRKTAEELTTLSTEDLVSYMDSFQEQQDAYLKEHEENERLKKEQEQIETQAMFDKVTAMINERRPWGIIYVIIIAAVYAFSLYVNVLDINSFLGASLSLLYWLVTTIGVNYVSHYFFWDGLASFFNRKYVENKLLKELQNAK